MASEKPPVNGQKDENDQTTRAADPSESQAGSVIGPYHLLEMIGEGGMGEVWVAEQKEPVRRRVALKLIKAGMDTREVVARFRSERQALALMDHPAIAKVFDAGSTPQGRPYFVMEYVAGMPITAYADKHKLTTRQRLELFMLVCEGVQHAHQKAIIHRDLKPSNILVSDVDGKPMPHIIDFGVAKATAQRLDAGTMYTQLGTLIGTLGYMSPEQADSGGEDIDTRSDVYSLGVVLYELLVGTLPLDFRKVAYNEFLRALREDAPQRPSTRLRTLSAESATAASNRGADPAALTRQLLGDPDAIALKALEKDRKRRYGSPAEMAADIGRCLRNEPVSAHAPSVGYRAGKYFRRHWVGVAAASAVLLLLVGFAVAQTIALRRITRERDRADLITEFMTSMFKVSDPSEARGNTVTAREILDKASKQIDTGLNNDPELQAKMMFTMGDTYHSLGLYPQADPLLKRAVEIQTRVLGRQNPDTLRSMSRLASTLTGEGHIVEGEKLVRETLEAQRRILGADSPDTLASMRCLTDSLRAQGRFPEAEKVARETLDANRRVLGSDQPDTLYSMDALAYVLEHEGQYPEAEKLVRESLEIQRRVLGPDHPNALASMLVVTETLLSEGKVAEAEKMAREAVDGCRRVLGPDHPNTMAAMGLLSKTLAAEGHLVEAESLFRETLDAQSRVLGPDNRITLSSMNDLTLILIQEGKFTEAEKMQRAVFESDSRVLGPDNRQTLESMEMLGYCLSHEQKYGEAEKLFREAIERAGKSNVPVAIGTAWYDFACAAAAAGRKDEAVEYLGYAIGQGPQFAAAIASDPDLKSLHGDPRFEALVAKAPQPANPPPK